MNLNNFNTKLVPEKLYTLIHVNHMDLSKNMLFGHQNPKIKTILGQMYSFCLNFALPWPKRRAQVQSKKITTLEKHQFIHVLKALKKD